MQLEQKRCGAGKVSGTYSESRKGVRNLFWPALPILNRARAGADTPEVVETARQFPALTRLSEFLPDLRQGHWVAIAFARLPRR